MKQIVSIIWDKKYRDKKYSFFLKTKLSSDINAPTTIKGMSYLIGDSDSFGNDKPVILRGKYNNQRNVVQLIFWMTIIIWIM